MPPDSGRARADGPEPRRERRPTADRNDAQNVTPEALAFDPALLLAASALARLLGVSRATIAKLHSSGRLPKPVRLGRRVLWSRTDITAWIAADCPSRDRWDVMREDRS